MTSHLPIIAVLTLFVSAFITALIGNKFENLRKLVVLVGTTVPLVLMIMLFRPVMLEGKILTYWMGNWKPVSDYAIGIGLEIDALSLFFAFIITLAVLISLDLF